MSFLKCDIALLLLETAAMFVYSINMIFSLYKCNWYPFIKYSDNSCDNEWVLLIYSCSCVHLAFVQAMADQIEQMGVLLETHQKVSFWFGVIFNCLESWDACCLCLIYVAYKLLSFVWVVTKQQLEELQDKYVAQVRQCSDLSGKLERTEVNYVKFFIWSFYIMDWC